MASSTYSGVTREVPILAYDVADASILVRGMIGEWDSSNQRVRPWTSGTIVPLGVCTGDADNRVLLVDVFVGKGCSVMIKCADGVVPNPNDFIFWSAPGVAPTTPMAIRHSRERSASA